MTPAVFGVEDWRIMAGLIREGWVEPAARRYVAEMAGRRRRRSGSGEGASLPSPEGLNSSQEVAVLHGPTMEKRNAESLIEKR
ncbi:hypothetical protein [Inquilinus sp.]|uniref:hypothetical protein n=1 Tax=Inquilinus sp. TaxID=1932117 RepID=UPI0031E23931